MKKIVHRLFLVILFTGLFKVISDAAIKLINLPHDIALFTGALLLCTSAVIYLSCMNSIFSSKFTTIKNFFKTK